MSKKKFAFFSLVAFTTALFSILCFNLNAEQFAAPGDTDEGKVVMVVADYLDVGDINRMGFLGRLAEESYVALVNNRQPGNAGASKAKLIIGAGKRLELNASMVTGGSDESFHTLYSIESGGPPKPNSLVYTDIFKLRKRNYESEYKKYIGYLGGTVKRNNGTTCFLGNADTELKNRSSILIAMDGNGEVDLGETENTIKEDRLFPYAKRTDYNKLAELYKQYLAASSFVVVETGDMERLERFRDFMSEDSYNAYKNTVLKEIDSFLEGIIRHGGFKTLVFMSTYPSKSSIENGNRLTPVVVFDASGEGVLYSGNTRREGIVLNTDLADYILCKLGYLSSSAVVELKKEKSGLLLEAMNSNIVATSVLRRPVLTAYAVVIIAAIVLLFITAVYSSERYIKLYSCLINITAYTMLAFPLALLYLPTASLGKSPALYLSFIAAASLAFSSILHITLKDKTRAVLIICMLQFLALTIDILTGSPFMKQSVLGYDPIIGARFYGIGNEYAGMFIGCTLIVFCCLREVFGNKLSKAAAVLYFIFCTLILGQSLLGANFGGAAAGASGYLLAYFLVYGIKFNKRNISLGILVLCTSAILMIMADSMGMGTSSHMGSLIKDTEVNGREVITATIQRKISMNLRLIRYTIWTKVLICTIAAISVMLFKPVKLLVNVFVKYKYLKYSWISIAVSAIVGLAVNDSGIVLAATAMIYVVFTMLLICIGERNES